MDGLFCGERCVGNEGINEMGKVLLVGLLGILAELRGVGSKISSVHLHVHRKLYHET